VIKKTCLLIFGLLILAGCGGRQPEPDWTAEEYYQYAKEKYDDEDYFEAVNDFTVVMLRYPGSTVADSAQFFLGMCHYYLEEYIISSAEFTKLINNMSRSPLVPDAQFMLAESYYEMSPRPALDQVYSIKALREYQLFLEDYPTHARSEEAERKIYELREKQAEKQWNNAELYRKMIEYRSSIIYYDIVIEQFYDTEYADDALYGKALVYVDLGEYTNAKEQLLLFKEKFPNSEIMPAVERLLSKTINWAEDEEPEED
jgi:outer membrane protein assembly factor BamD